MEFHTDSTQNSDCIIESHVKYTTKSVIQKITTELFIYK